MVVTELGLPYSAQALAGRVQASNPALTVLLLVSARDPSPQQAAAIANAVSVQLGRVIEKLETPTAQTVAPVKVTLTDPAVPPTAASSPNTQLNNAVGLLLGLAVGLAWAFVRGVS